MRYLFIAFGALAPASLFGAFGLTTTTDLYTVDTGAGLVFSVRRTEPPNNQQTQGDISSLIYKGVQYQDQVRGSQVGIGIGGGAVSAETDNATYVKITVTAPDGDMTHYYLARNGYANIYMGTYFNSEPQLGNVRYIVRIPHTLLPNGPAPSDLTGTTGAIESGDVFGLPNGESRSKHYSNHRQMDWKYTGATGTNVGVWMVKGNEEGMSGGPFYRSLINQGGDDQEIYELINYGEAQSEAYRTSILNLYTLSFTDGGQPGPIDLSWMDSLNLIGWIPASARGGVSGSVSGVPAGFQAVVGFANATAQYWATADGSGAYTCSGMIPGDYTATLYKGELAVATGTVTITAGGTATLNLASTETISSAIFRIGEWDGTPNGFLNADKITIMHPSDVRMDPWTNTTYTVGVDSPSAFPSIQTRAANSPFTIKFNLAPNQITALTLKIGITIAYNSGRPQISVNNSYTSPVINASNQPSTRSFTVGTYRGNNTTFTYTIPASALVVGTNTMTISPISGSADLSTWLSAGWVYDAVELDGPIATPTINYVGANPLVISGTSEPSRAITVTLDGATVLGSTVAAANGVWSLTVNSPISVGAHSVVAVASDGAGHDSPASTAFAFNTGVTMPVIVSATGDTGTYSSGATTSDRVFVFSGTAGANNNVTLTRIGVGAIGSTTADASGSWTFDYSGVSLPDGSDQFYATATSGGNSSAASPIFTLNLSGAPRVAIARYVPATKVITTNIGSVVYRVTFNHNVSNVSPAAFQLTATGTAGGAIAGVSASSGTIFDVTVNSLVGTGDLRLDLKPGIVLDDSSAPEAAYTAGERYSLVTPSFGSGVWVQPATGGFWSDALNWLNAVIADGASSSANFTTLDLTANNTVHLDAPRTLNSASFADTDATTSASWTVDNNGSAANTLTFAGASPTITVGTLASDAAVTVSAGLGGSSGLTKAGTGTLVLSGQSTLTGTLNVNGGVLRVAPGAALALGNNPVNTATNVTLNVTGGTFSAGGLTSVATAMVVDGGSTNLGSFRTNATFGTILRVNGGSLTIGDVNLQRTAGTTPDYTSGLIVAGGSMTATTLRVGTSNSYANVSVEGTGTLNVTGAVTLGAQTTGGRGGALRVIGNGVFNSTDTALGVVMGRTTGGNANNVATATFTGGVSTVEKFTLGFDSTVTAGSATITVNGGALYLGSGGIVKNGTSGMATTISLSSGTLGAKANWATTLPVTLPTNGNITLRASDASDAPFDISLGGVVSGAGALTKTGAGTLTLSAANTYTGATTINSGVLSVTGSLASATNGIAVNNSGVLAGSGTISRSTTLNLGGAIAPAGLATIGNLTAADLTWNGGGALKLDLGAAGVSDKLILNGQLAKGSAGAYSLTLNATAPIAHGDSFTVASFGSTTFAASDFTVGGLPVGYAGVASIEGTALRVTIVARPTITSTLTASGMFGSPFSYAITADHSPSTFSAVGLPPGLNLAADGTISGTPGAAGTFNVLIGATNLAGTGTASLALTIAPAPATVTLTGSSNGQPIRVAYDGAAKTPSITTTPAGVPVTFTFNGSSTPPSLPGTYAVTASVSDPNYTGSTQGTLVITTTALVRHAPTLNAGLDGSLQLLSAEDFALGSAAYVSGDLLVPGTPQVQLNGQPTFGGVQDASGAATPSNYTLTLNQGSVLRHVVRRVDPIELETVAAPPLPAGTRNVTLGGTNTRVGDWATVRNLTLNSGPINITVPAGTYGDFTANSGAAFVLGVAGSTQPAVYNFQNLALNGGSQFKVVGPVVVVCANGLTLNALAGASAHPEWLSLRIASGGLTLNTSATFYGEVLAPNGTVSLNGSALLNGRVSADRLTINGSALLDDAGL